MIPEGAENHIADSKADNEAKLPLETQMPTGDRKIKKDLAQKYADEWNSRYPNKAFMKWDDYWETACTAFDYFKRLSPSLQDIVQEMEERLADNKKIQEANRKACYKTPYLDGKIEFAEHYLPKLKQIGEGSESYKANFLWGFTDNSIESIGYEFANAKTEEYQKECWNNLLEKLKSSIGEETEGQDEVIEVLAKALRGLVDDVRNKPNDTRYATHLKIANEALEKYTLIKK